MDKVSLQDRLVSFLVNEIPKEKLIQLDQEIRIQYAKADARAQEDFQHFPPRRPRGQSRHYHISEAFAKCGADVKTTPNSSEDYVILHCGKASISHVEQKSRRRPKKPASYQLAMAEDNQKLEPAMADLFDGFPEITNNDTLHASIIIASPEPSDPIQGKPKYIHITVPYKDYSDSHLRMDLEEFLNKYDEASGTDSSELDFAWPSLRNDILHKEKQSDDDDG